MIGIFLYYFRRQVNNKILDLQFLALVCLLIRDDVYNTPVLRRYIERQSAAQTHRGSRDKPQAAIHFCLHALQPLAFAFVYLEGRHGLVYRERDAQGGLIVAYRGTKTPKIREIL